ncbi:hypothetical protein GBA52_000631 [Prunus armeniaca]|nr:hypothetical protein GBA52_000631 [Prunus armeniaca]
MVLRHFQLTSSSAPRREREGREIVAWILESFFFDEGQFAYSTSSDIPGESDCLELYCRSIFN